MHQGVYAVGHPRLTAEGRWMAAVLACGSDAVLSHRSAAALWGLIRDSPEVVHVSVPSYSGRERRSGIRLHRRAALDRISPTRHKGIAVSTPAQRSPTCGSCVPPPNCDGNPTGGGAGPAHRVDPSYPTRSELEHLFVRLRERHRLPRPEVNVRVGSYEVDFLWRAERLVVETDGYKYHRGAQAFEDDHQRDLTIRPRTSTCFASRSGRSRTNPRGLPPWSPGTTEIRAEEPAPPLPCQRTTAARRARRPALRRGRRGGRGRAARRRGTSAG